MVIRHDREDSRYTALGSKFPSYCPIRLPDGGGASIALEWILTAAHVAEEIKTLPHKVQCGNVMLDVERVAVHPDYKKIGKIDVALLKFFASVTEIKAVPIKSK